MKFSDISLLYILNHSLIRIRDFFRHWYIDGFLRSIDWTLDIFEQLDRKFALRITAKNWFQPLYQDYTLIGYVWGFIFRTARIIAGSIAYILVLSAAVSLFLLWAALPALAIYQIFKNL